jgi:PAS domain S-box-containing protein
MNAADVRSEESPARPSRSFLPRWRWLYFLLAAFDVLAVSLGLYLNHRIMTVYSRSVQMNHTWMTLLQETSKLSELAAAVNAPGNDIFASYIKERTPQSKRELVSREAVRSLMTYKNFTARSALLEQQISDAAGPLRGAPLLHELEILRSGVSKMQREVAVIFGIFRDVDEQKLELAGEQMALMDRTYGEVNKAFAQLRAHIGENLEEIFDEEREVAATQQRYEYGFAVLILGMVGAATLYGHRLGRQIAADTAEKDRYIGALRDTEDALRRAHGALETRVQERTAELLQANESLRSEIAERRRVEEALRGSEDRYRTLIESTHDLIQSVAPDGHFLFVNHAWLAALGYSESELPNLTCEAIIAEASRFHCREVFARLLAGEEPGTVQTAFLTKDGRTIPVEGNLAVHRTDHGAVEIQGFFRDVTDRERAEASRRRLLEQVLSAQEEERRRIARDLHDEIGQALTSVLIGLKTLEGVAVLQPVQAQARELRGIVGQTLEEVRRLARGLRPSVLDDLGLAAALERAASDFTQAHGIPVEVRAAALDKRRLPEAVETALYRIAQEALTNVAKHAAARKVRIDVNVDPGGIDLRVVDDGRGFASDALLRRPAGQHLGLSGMRERAALLGGTCAVDSQPGRGTRVRVRLPLTGSNDGQSACPDRG